MNSEYTDEVSNPPVRSRQSSDDSQDSGVGNRRPATDATRQPPDATRQPADDTTRREATVIVRGETVRDEEPKSAPKDQKSPPPVSEAKVKMQSRLPALDDDSDAGVQKEITVIRDGKADLSFTGQLLASSAPASAPKGQWQEYRIYETNGGKHVFSKVTRNIIAEQQDTHEADIFDPAPTSVPSQLLRSARDLTRSQPMTWRDAAVAFFGYDPLAKALYRKLGGQFEDRIS